ncbi:5'-nucleotidase domain-containing protein 1 [Choloepus didactylus]|uniref:5'-nucleotidase domain-containing protein 1 n=1 Tax=Choloepus didactylus TaxID=27675 RepID=UPI0018A06A90|nr:5'-nucleotidase domain-containing protein 1 [Choloepus didactylus]
MNKLSIYSNGPTSTGIALVISRPRDSRAEPPSSGHQQRAVPGGPPTNPAQGSPFAHRAGDARPRAPPAGAESAALAHGFSLAACDGVSFDLDCTLCRHNLSESATMVSGGSSFYCCVDWSYSLRTRGCAEQGLFSFMIGQGILWSPAHPLPPFSIFGLPCALLTSAVFCFHSGSLKRNEASGITMCFG